MKKYPYGKMFDIRETVQPKQAGVQARLDVGNAEMMADLAEFAPSAPRKELTSAEFPFLLLPRRITKAHNSAWRNTGKLVDRGYNPAYLHPDDLTALGLRIGDRVEIASEHGEIVAIVDADAKLRRGCVSITHGYGGNPGEAEDPVRDGCNVGRLMRADLEYDRMSGMPRLGALPVAIREWRAASAAPV